VFPYGGSDSLFDPVLTSTKIRSAGVKTEKTTAEAASSEAVTSDLFEDGTTGDSLFSKRQKGLTHR